MYHIEIVNAWCLRWEATSSFGTTRVFQGSGGSDFPLEQGHEPPWPKGKMGYKGLPDGCGKIYKDWFLYGHISYVFCLFQHIYIGLPVDDSSCRSMADKSFAWAKARGLVRDNTVHGEEEAKLVLEDSFANNNEKGEMTGLRADGLVEDPAFSIFTARWNTQ